MLLIEKSAEMNCLGKTKLRYADDDDDDDDNNLS
jgi:hypothetical protein